MLKSSSIDTPIGKIIAISDEKALYTLNFADLVEEKAPEGITSPILSIQEELKAYFSGNLKAFQTPIAYRGSPFQVEVWEALRQIPYGETRSYKEIAEAVGKPSGARAVGKANGTNILLLIVPCHRVINASGAMGGFGAGIFRKEWLLNHEMLRRG